MTTLWAMSPPEYRSFVVRIWRRDGIPVRAAVEEIQSGRQADLRGDQASVLADALDDALPAVTKEPGEPVTGATGGERSPA